MVGVPEETDGDQRLSVAERDVRVAAPIGLEATSRDLIQARRRRDLQRVLVWYARRNLDDCYGAGPRPPHAVAASTVFFDRATRDYVLAAELMTTPDAATTEQLERLGTERAGVPGVFVVDPGGTARFRSVHPGRLWQDLREIRAGVEIEMRVVIAPSAALRDGDRVLVERAPDGP